MDEELLDSYIEDLRESLITLDEELIKLRQGITDTTIINNIFRVAHTIKGNSAAMEFFRIEKVMHSLEDILQEVRNNTRELTATIIDIMFSCHDFLEDCMTTVARDHADQAVEIDQMLNRLDLVYQIETIEPIHDVDFPTSEITSNSELLDIIIANVTHGYKAYELVVTLDHDSLMKAVTAWLVFERVEQNAILVHSEPARPSEETFKSPAYNFAGQEIRLLILSDSPLDYLSAEIKLINNITDAYLSLLSLEQIRSLLGGVNTTQEALSILSEIEIMALGDVSSKVLDQIQKLLAKMGSLVLAEPLLQAAVQAVIEALKEITAPKVSIEITSLLVSICHLMEVSLKVPSMLGDAEFFSQMESDLEKLTALANSEEPKVGEIMVQKGWLDQAGVEEILEQQQVSGQGLKFGQVAVKDGKVPAYQVMQVLKEQQEPLTRKPKPMTNSETGFVRIPVNKVDSLMDMLGELLILNSQLEVGVSNRWGNDSSMLNVLSHTAKLIKGIQSLSMSLRMVEIRGTLHRLTRIARDTAAELNKRVLVTLEGENTEIDRSAAERFFDPLMHLVRNSVAHGIETETERTAAGKKPEGQVIIRCYSKRGNVYIEVVDDGRGMNAQAIMAKAQALQLVDNNREYTEDEILRFIYEPGFSTSEQIDNISGRGVGLNVVHEEVRRAGGKIDIINHPGQGCSFILRIPMNLAIVNGTIIEIAGSRYIIPTLFIKEFFVAEANDWLSMQGQLEAMRLRNLVVPVLWADKLFQCGSPEHQKARKLLVIIELEQKLLAFPVDKIIARQEVVAKPLINELASIDYASGASILGDGSVAFILDVEAMFNLIS